MLKKFKTYQLVIAGLFFVSVAFAFTHVLAVFSDCGYSNIENGVCNVSYNFNDVLSGIAISFLICVLILGLLHDASMEIKKTVTKKPEVVKTTTKKVSAKKAVSKATPKKTAVKKTK